MLPSSFCMCEHSHTHTKGGISMWLLHDLCDSRWTEWVPLGSIIVLLHS